MQTVFSFHYKDSVAKGWGGDYAVEWMMKKDKNGVIRTPESTHTMAYTILLGHSAIQLALVAISDPYKLNSALY